VVDGVGPQLNFSSSLRSWQLNNPIRHSTKLLFKRFHGDVFTPGIAPLFRLVGVRPVTLKSMSFCGPQ